MFRFFKIIWRNLAVFFLASVFSFCLFMMFLNPLHPLFFLGERLNAAADGVANTASVPLNPINKLAMQLDQKEKELSEKERFLDDRALALEKENSVWKNRVIQIVLAGLILIFFLVLLNFYFDSKRNKELKIIKKE